MCLPHAVKRPAQSSRPAARESPLPGGLSCPPSPASVLGAPTPCLGPAAVPSLLPRELSPGHQPARREPVLLGRLPYFPEAPPPAAGDALGSGAADSKFGAAPGRQGKITTSSSSSRGDLKLASRTRRVISLHAAKHRWYEEPTCSEPATCTPMSLKRNLSETSAPSPNAKSMNGCSFSPIRWMFEVNADTASPEGNLTRARLTVWGVPTLPSTKQGSVSNIGAFSKSIAFALETSNHAGLPSLEEAPPDMSLPTTAAYSTEIFILLPRDFGSSYLLASNDTKSGAYVVLCSHHLPIFPSQLPPCRLWKPFPGWHLFRSILFASVHVYSCTFVVVATISFVSRLKYIVRGLDNVSLPAAS